MKKHQPGRAGGGWGDDEGDDDEEEDNANNNDNDSKQFSIETDSLVDPASRYFFVCVFCFQSLSPLFSFLFLNVLRNLMCI